MPLLSNEVSSEARGPTPFSGFEAPLLVVQEHLTLLWGRVLGPAGTCLERWEGGKGSVEILEVMRSLRRSMLLFPASRPLHLSPPCPGRPPLPQR